MVQKHCTNLCAKSQRDIIYQLTSALKEVKIPQFNAILSLNTRYLFLPLDTAYSVHMYCIYGWKRLKMFLKNVII
jgi:hypothetical protein